MRNYEALYVLRPDLGDEEIEALVTRFSQLVSNAGGEVLKLDPWGKRRLAYEVKKLREGYYVLMQFKGSADIARELERVLKITDNVIRQLIVRMEEGLPVADEEAIEEAEEEVQEEETAAAE